MSSANAATMGQSRRDSPMVSIGMAIYNEEKHLAGTIEGLLKQDYPNFELVISDNASTDRTREICLEYEKRDSRIRYCPLEETITAGENFNRVFGLLRGEFFMWAAGHDRYDPTFISACLKEMQTDPNLVLCYPLILPITDDGKPIHVLPTQAATQGIPGPVLRCLLSFWHLGGYEIHGLLRSDAVRRTRLLMTNTIGPDIIFLCELALVGTFACLHAPLYSPRQKWTAETTFDDSLARYSKGKYFWKTESAWRFPNWRFFGELLRAMGASPISLRRKTILLSLLSFLFLKKHYRMLAADLVRPFSSK